MALYLAEKDAAPGEILAPEPLSHQLYVLYGYPYYKLIKQSDLDPKGTWNQWFQARPDFSLRIFSLPEQDNPLGYEVYKDDALVAQGKYHPIDGVPLFINGPFLKSSRLIMAIWSH